MTGSGHYLMLNLVVFACIISISCSAAVLTSDRVLPVITFINDVAPAQAIKVDDNNNDLPIATVKVGAEYKWHIAENVGHSCFAQREDFYFALFDCYQPSTDFGKTVYWLMNSDGIQLSWDKATWKKIVKWTYKE